MVLVSSADHTSASTTVHDRGRPSGAKPDERRSVQTFEAQAQRQGVPGDAREWQHTRHGGVHDHAESETTELWRQRPLHAQHVKKRAEENTWVSTWTGEQLVGKRRWRAMECHGERLMECHDDRERLMECHDDRKRRTQALDKPRHHTAKTVCVRRSRGETDALANSDAGERVQLNSSSQPTG